MSRHKVIYSLYQANSCQPSAVLWSYRILERVGVGRENLQVPYESSLSCWRCWSLFIIEDLLSCSRRSKMFNLLASDYTTDFCSSIQFIHFLSLSLNVLVPTEKMAFAILMYYSAISQWKPLHRNSAILYKKYSQKLM